MLNIKLLRDIVILLIGFGLIWLVFTLFFADKEPTEVISIEKEEKLGKFFVESIQQDPKYKPTGSIYSDSCLQVIMHRLLKPLNSDYEYQVYLFDNAAINAFAMPGGHILVSTGLIGITDNPEELAAVLAHEIGHIEKKHLIGKLIKDMGLSLLFSGDALIMTELSHMAASHAFDRNKESEADEFALELLEKVNINPRMLGIFFRKMKEAEVDYDRRLELLMTHPHSDSRIRKALEYELTGDFQPVPIDLDWDRLKMAVEKSGS